jgi:hypothetical protein
MSKVVVISIVGETGLWIADLTNGTVVPLEPPKSGGLKVVTDLAMKGSIITKDVNVAVVVDSAQDAFSGRFVV